MRIFNYKKLLALILSLLMAVSCITGVAAADSSASNQLTFMSFNLRYDTTSEPLMGLDVRGPHLLEIIQKYDPDSIGFQEATDDWMGYLREAMAEIGYAYVGVGRDTGTDDPSRSSTGNEFTPVFYKADKFELLDSDTFWLSQHPDQVSGTDWGAANTRIATYAVLQDKETGLAYIHFNTHLDHVSLTADQNGARILLNRIAGVSAAYGGLACVSTGDYNSDRYNETYNIMTSRMDDAWAIAEEVLVDGPTTNGYQKPSEWEEGQTSFGDMPSVDISSSPIDYLFLSKGRFTVDTYSVVNDTFTFEYGGQTWHNHPVSDHYGVYCTVQLLDEPGDDTPDESALIDLPAAVYTDAASGNPISDYSLARIEAFANAAADATVSSNMTLADDAGSLQSGIRLGEEEGKVFWELTVNLPYSTSIAALSLTLGDIQRAVPSNAELFLSADGASWKKAGASILEQPAAGSTFYYLLDEAFDAKYVKLLIVDAAAGAEIKGLSVFGMQSPLSPLDSKYYTPISGPSAGGEEGYEKLFDGTTGTKFYTKDADSVTIVWKTNGAVTAQQYSLTTGNDSSSNPQRYFQSWTLYGSPDGAEGGWTILDQVSGYTFPAENYAECVFTIDNPASYTYYQIVFTDPADESRRNMQFSELNLYVEANLPAPVPQSRMEPISGPRPGEEEGYEKLFDGTTGTKFYTRDADAVTIVWKADAAITARQYSLVTGNDNATNPNRYFKSWILYGSADGTDDSWTVIDQVTDYTLPAANYTEVIFYIEDPAPYTYYQIVFTDPADTSNRNIQLSELNLYVQADIAQVAQSHMEPVSGPAPRTETDVEVYQNLFDGDLHTKLYYRDTLPDSIIWKADREIVPAMYAFVLSNDAQTYPNRNPLGWRLYGSPDGTDRSWVFLDEKTDYHTPGQNSLEVDFALPEIQDAYTYFRLDITQMETDEGTPRMQIAEVLLYEKAAPADYSSLDETLLQLPSNLDNYTADSAAALTAALAAVVRGLDIADQAEVDAMAQAIEDAINALQAITKGDLDGNGEVDILDVMAACRILARKNAGSMPNNVEIQRGDMTGDGQVTIEDIMAICRILASKNS